MLELGLPAVGKAVREPHESQPEDDLQADVESCGEKLPIARERNGLVAERREGRKAPEQTDKGKRPELRGRHLTRIREAGEQTDQEATNEIHTERAVGKLGKGQVPLDHVANRVAQEGSDKTARPYEKRI